MNEKSFYIMLVALLTAMFLNVSMYAVEPTSVTDVQGNTYPVVKIGNQYWMAENLKCSKYDTQSEAYKEGRYTVPTSEEAVYTPYYTDASDWSRWNEDSKTKYGVNLTYVQIAKLGYLYNWAAAVGVADGQGQTTAFSGNRQGICPNGWHIPSMEEWRTMQTTIQDFYDKGIENNEGIHMKTILGWYDNGDNDNASKFSALPAGYALGSDVSNVGINTQYWSSFNQERNSSYTRSLEYYVPILFAINENKAAALSVRCLRNTPAEPQCPVVYPTEGAITLVFKTPAEMECTPTIQFVGDASEHAWYVGYPTNPRAEALGDGWYKLVITMDYTMGKIIPIRMDGTPGWEYQGKYQQVEGREVEWLKIADYGEHQLEFSEGKNGGVAYLNVFQWNSDPCEPPIPAGKGTFSVTFTGECLPSAAAGDKVFIAGNFEDVSWERVYEMTQGAGNTWTYVDLTYPADFKYKFVVKYNNSDEELWVDGDNVIFDGITYDSEFEGPCPSTHIREKCKASDYPQVTIGSQVWMAENYRCSKYDTQSEAYKEGRYTIPTSKDYAYTPYYTDASDKSKWNSFNREYGVPLTDAQVKKLGYLYNWAAAVGVADGQKQTTAFSGTRQGICPNGWHVPSRVEWQTLYDYIYSAQKLSSNKVGKYLKTTSGWFYGGNGTDSYGFAALPAGYAVGGEVDDIDFASFWTVTPNESGSDYAYGRYLYYAYDHLSEESTHGKVYGHSVRCLRNTPAETKRPIVNPTPGMATIVFSVPEVSCDYTTMNFVGDVQGYNLDAEGLPVAEFVEAGWYKLVLPLTEGGSTQGMICPQSLTGKSRWDYQGTYSLPEGAPDWISIVNAYGTSNGLVLSEGCSGQVAYVDVTAWQTDFCRMLNPEGQANFTVSFEIPKTANPSEAIVYVEGQGEGQSWGELGELLYDDRSESFTGAFDVPAGCFYKYVISYKGGNRIYMKGDNLPMPYALIADDFVNEWDNDPWVEPIPGGVGTFSVTFTGECLPSAALTDKVFIAGNFEDTPGWERVYELTPEDGTNTWVIKDLTYPAAFEFKFVVKYNGSEEELWVPADNIQFDEMTYDFELEGPCPSTHIREKCKASDYPQVTIGTQVWMAENYRCSKYDTQSEAYKEGRYTVPTSENIVYTPYYTDALDRNKWEYDYVEYLTDAQVAKLGYLYNWTAAVGVANGEKQTTAFTDIRQGICPNGWHVPSRAEWQTLVDYIEKTDGKGTGTVGKHLKTTSGWYDGDSGYKPGLDTYGFAALPAGSAYGNGVYYVGNRTYFWTATSGGGGSSSSYMCGIDYYDDPMFGSSSDRSYGQSVRCIKNNSLTISPVSTEMSYIGGTIYIGVASNTSWSVSSNQQWATVSPTRGNGIAQVTVTVQENTSTLADKATITFTADDGTVVKTVINRATMPPTPTEYITDVCGNTYPVVKIGKQYWMAENMACKYYDTESEAYKAGFYELTKSPEERNYAPSYIDGRVKSNWSDRGEYAGNLSDAQIQKLGLLYNWAAAMGYKTADESKGQKRDYPYGDRQGICPNGWHIPSIDEWSMLVRFVNDAQVYSANQCLKSISGWYGEVSNYTPGLDIYGFCGLPAGEYRSSLRGVGEVTNWWSSTADMEPPIDSSEGIYFTGAEGKALSYDDERRFFGGGFKYDALSVRCIKDSEKIHVSPTSLDVKYSGGQFTIDITSNTSWSVSCDKSWVTLSETQGSGNKAITANVAPNTTISNRNATITFTTAGGKTAFVTVNMEGVTPTPKDYSGVMLQGFYWDSYNENYAKKANGESYGRTKWADLKNQAQEIAQTFDMIWLPPSAQSEGGTGYHPIQWSNQTSEWGSVTQLKELIFTLKTSNPDMNVIADIVINHKGGNDWIDLRNENFGMYGSFTLRESGQTSKYICRDDEVSKQAGWTATGANDAGYDVQCEASGGYCVARDLDHSNEYLRSAIKAYLSWMKNEIGYDGWRYDYVKGYLGKYIKEYNQASAGAFSVGEYWDGSYDALTNWINETGKTSNAFDFNLKYNGFNNGLASGNYRALVGIGAGAGLIGDNTYKQYAVTFVDNHDTFRVNDSKFEGDWTQANAYIIAMPGTPCVFYPHWVKCKEDIKKMIAVRKACGITNTSSASCSSTGSYFRGEVTGSKGKLVVFIGSQGTCPSGFKLACSGNGWAYYTNIEVVMPITVKLKASSLSEDWENVNMYYWGNKVPSWPGVKPENIDRWYSYTIQGESSVGVIWNNTGSKNYKQTNDIYNVTTSTCYAMNEETDHVFEVDCQTGRPIVTPKKGYITLVFKKPESTKCNPILEWVGDNVEPVWTVGGDGNVIGKYVGDGWYSFELPHKEGGFSGQILYGNKTMRAPNWSAAYNLVYAEETPTWAKIEGRQFTFTGGKDNTVIYVSCGSWDGDYDPCGEIVKVNLTSTEGGYAYGQEFCGKGMDVTISAYPDEGYEFVQWSDGNTDNPRTIRVTEDVNLSASFAKLKYTITFKNEDGTELQKGDVEYGVVPKYTGAVPTKPSTAQYTYTFAGWDKEIVAVKTSATYTAIYSKVINEYNVTLSAGVGGVANGSGKYKYGSNAVVEALPNAGYRFVQWSDDNIENPRTLVVLKDVSYTAIFAAKTYTVELSADNAKGSVYGAGKYTYGKTATVYAKPAAGYMFASWSDGVTTNPRNIVVSNDVSLEALFVRASYNIEVTVNDMTMGVAFGSGIYDYGEEVSLEAMAFDDYEFVSWNDGNKENPRVFNATRDLSFVANFRDKELTTEAADLVNSECTAYANGNHIIAQSKSDCEIKIYDSVGRILTDCGTTDYCDCYAPVSGLYLVTFGEKSIKVQVR